MIRTRRATDRAPIKVRKQERGKGKERKGKERKGVIAAKNSYEENGSAHGRGDPVDAAARGRRRRKNRREQKGLRNLQKFQDPRPKRTAMDTRAAAPEESAAPP